MTHACAGLHVAPWELSLLSSISVSFSLRLLLLKKKKDLKTVDMTFSVEKENNGTERGHLTALYVQHNSSVFFNLCVCVLLFSIPTCYLLVYLHWLLTVCADCKWLSLRVDRSSTMCVCFRVYMCVENGACARLSKASLWSNTTITSHIQTQTHTQTHFLPPPCVLPLSTSSLSYGKEPIRLVSVCFKQNGF